MCKLLGSLCRGMNFPTDLSNGDQSHSSSSKSEHNTSTNTAGGSPRLVGSPGESGANKKSSNTIGEGARKRMLFQRTSSAVALGQAERPAGRQMRRSASVAAGYARPAPSYHTNFAARRSLHLQDAYVQSSVALFRCVGNMGHV